MENNNNDSLQFITDESMMQVDEPNVERPDLGETQQALVDENYRDGYYEDEYGLEEDYNEEEDLDFEDYSKAALQAKLLEDNGLQIYEELDPELTFEQFSQDVPIYIDNIVNSQIQEKLEELGTYADYIEMMQSGVQPDEFEPALIAETIANFDINADNVTDQDLYNIVIQTEMRKGNDEDTAILIANGALDKGIEYLTARAESDIQYTRDYIEQTKHEIRERYAEEERLQQEAIEYEHEVFTQTLANSSLTPREQNNLYDFYYNRDQIVNVPQEDGSYIQTAVTKWELAIDQALQDPQSKLALVQFLASGLNAENLVGSRIERNLSKRIIGLLDGRDY